MIKLVLLRHGESTWNKENRFTGWVDVDLSEKGVEEAHEAARSLQDKGFQFDIAFTSVLKRATRTLRIVMDDMGIAIPVKNSWRLNERFYGGLTGLNKSETAAKFGEEQVHIWRRSYDVPPPALTEDDERYPGKDALYADVPKDELPLAECLKDTEARVMPYWDVEIVPALKSGKRVLVSAHGNSIRAIVKNLDDMPEDEIMQLNIPTGIPLIYELDDNLRPIRHYYLADEETLKAAEQKVKNQGKSN